jgi:hypothetical protein
VNLGERAFTECVEDEFSEVGSLAIKVPKIRNLGDVLGLVGRHDAYSEKG